MASSGCPTASPSVWIIAFLSPTVTISVCRCSSILDNNEGPVIDKIRLRLKEPCASPGRDLIRCAPGPECFCGRIQTRLVGCRRLSHQSCGGKTGLCFLPYAPSRHRAIPSMESHAFDGHVHPVWQHNRQGRSRSTHRSLEALFELP